MLKTFKLFILTAQKRELSKFSYSTMAFCRFLINKTVLILPKQLNKLNKALGDWKILSKFETNTTLEGFVFVVNGFVSCFNFKLCLCWNMEPFYNFIFVLLIFMGLFGEATSTDCLNCWPLVPFDKKFYCSWVFLFVISPKALL